MRGDDRAAKVLARIAAGARTAAARRCALEHIEDVEILLCAARTDPDADVRRVALARIEDQAALTRFACEAADPALARATARRLRDPASACWATARGA